MGKGPFKKSKKGSKGTTQPTREECEEVLALNTEGINQILSEWDSNNPDQAAFRQRLLSSGLASDQVDYLMRDAGETPIEFREFTELHIICGVLELGVQKGWLDSDQEKRARQAIQRVCDKTGEDRPALKMRPAMVGQPAEATMTQAVGVIVQQIKESLDWISTLDLEFRKKLNARARLAYEKFNLESIERAENTVYGRKAYQCQIDFVALGLLLRKKWLKKDQEDQVASLFERFSEIVTEEAPETD